MDTVAEEASTSYSELDTVGAPDRLLRKAEGVLSRRSERILLVLERCTDNQNYLACLRTAEILGEPCGSGGSLPPLPRTRSLPCPHGGLSPDGRWPLLSTHVNPRLTLAHLVSP